MRKKLKVEQKRSVIIGIKVKQSTRDKIEYLSEIQDIKMSSYINNIIEEHIDEKIKMFPLDWEEELKEFKERKMKNDKI
ncbi:MAG: hypothetical protein IJO56_06340 [Oscillospiraceae bacterium]|nr:hypothetical protein [Oscillospiraceae bacterium]